VSTVIEQIWEGRSRRARAAAVALTPAAWAFSAAARLRATLYDHGLLAVRRASVPVVSVGNLRVGATGKTPFVIWLVAQLRERGVSAVVVSRGYRRKCRRPATLAWADGAVVAPVGTADPMLVVPGDARSALHAVGDEALLVAARTGAPVLTFADRVTACQLAERAWKPDLILLDDGFQHRRIARDLDVVLLRGDEHRAKTLPAGPLREPIAALARADVRIGPCGTGGLPCVRRHPLGLVRTVWQADLDKPCRWLSGRKVVAVAGVGNPEAFVEMLERTGANVRATLRFRDHHSYDRSDWERIRARARGCEAVVTTEKDLVKLATLADSDVDLLALRLGLEVRGAHDLLDRVAGLDPRHRPPHDRSLHEPGRT